VGNPCDNTFTGTIIPAIGTSYASALVGSTVTHSVAFFLPPSAPLTGRGLRVRIHPNGNPNVAPAYYSQSNPLTVQLPATGPAVVNYNRPAITSVVVSLLPASTPASTVSWILANLPGSTFGSTIIQLILLGTNFGPSPAVTGDTVARVI
jgi:hypothetical protein